MSQLYNFISKYLTIVQFFMRVRKYLTIEQFFAKFVSHFSVRAVVLLIKNLLSMLQKFYQFEVCIAKLRSLKTDC